MNRPFDAFNYRDGELHVGDLAVTEIASAAGTPVFIYSAEAIRAAYHRIERAFAPINVRLHYAVKASSNLNILRLLRELGAGMDVVSGGELERAWLAGTPMDEIVFAGVGKSRAEQRAALDGRFSPLAGAAESLGGQSIESRGPVGLFNVESASELEVLAEVSTELKTGAHACIRVNPDVDARAHEYTTTGKEENKFGVGVAEIPALFDTYRDHPSIRLTGLHVHIGSPVRAVDPYESAVRVLLELTERLEAAGHSIEVLDLGGGWPMCYEDGESPDIEEYARSLIPMLEPSVEKGIRVVLEPGRSILANSGVLLTRVQHVKEGRSKRFVVCDAGIHTLIRPALYKAFHFMWPVRVNARQVPPIAAEALDLPGLHPSDVVGPICETGDFLARGRGLPAMQRDELLAVFSAGAYGMSMSSNYNDHPRSAEVMVDNGRAILINRRQEQATLLQTELSPREL